MVGTVSAAPTGIASNSARLIGRAVVMASPGTPSANSTGRCDGSTLERRPSRISHTSSPYRSSTASRLSSTRRRSDKSGCPSITVTVTGSGAPAPNALVTASHTSHDERSGAVAVNSDGAPGIPTIAPRGRESISLRRTRTGLSAAPAISRADAKFKAGYRCFTDLHIQRPSVLVGNDA